jgi:hypothetical protein
MIAFFSSNTSYDELLDILTERLYALNAASIFFHTEKTLKSSYFTAL